MDITKWIVELVFLGIPAWVAAWYYWKQVQLMRRPQQQKELFQAKQRWYHRQWPLLLMAVLLIANWIPHFLVQPVSPEQVGHCKVLLEGWGWSPPRLTAQVDSDLVKDHQADSHLMFVGRPADHTIDAKQDKNIFKSQLFGIPGGLLPIETVLNDAEVKHVLAAAGWIEMRIMLLPKDVRADQITTIEDAEKLGAKEMDFRMFQVPVSIVAVPPGGAPPSGPGVY